MGRIPPTNSTGIWTGDWSHTGGGNQAQPDNREFSENQTDEACIAILNNCLIAINFSFQGFCFLFNFLGFFLFGSIIRIPYKKKIELKQEQKRKTTTKLSLYKSNVELQEFIETLKMK